MEAEELDFAIDELEIRLERLRALYEQYFLGIEKLEPQVARKDVDRRIFVLRREKIRNTGRRFKLQTLIQRYNTFQQYWQRICREIENGTYKRHLIRAEKLAGPSALLTIAARRRFGRDRQPGPSDAAPAADARASQVPEPPQDEVTHRILPPPSGVAPPPESEGADPAAPRPRSRVPTLPGLSSAPPPPLPAPSPERIPPPAPTPMVSLPPAARAMSTRAPRPGSPFESLELDMDFMGDWDPSAAARGRAGSPSTINARPAARVHSERPASAPAPERRLAPPPKPLRAPASMPSSPEPEPAPRAAAPAPAASSPVAAAAPPPAAAKPAKPAQAQKPIQAQKSPARPAGETTVSDGKLKELHQRFTEASKSAGQPAVSFEGLSKSLRAAEAKLREKHGNRRIDFEVVLKDGKPVVKPVVR